MTLLGSGNVPVEPGPARNIMQRIKYIVLLVSLIIILRVYTDNKVLSDIEPVQNWETASHILDENVNTNDTKNRTDLIKAILNGNTGLAKLLINRGAYVNAKDDDGITPLMGTAYNGLTYLAKLLIIKGADVNAKDNDGITPLMGAAFNGHIDLAELLIRNGADINAKEYTDDETALIYATRNGHKNIAELLKRQGATEEPNSTGCCIAF